MFQAEAFAYDDVPAAARQDGAAAPLSAFARGDRGVIVRVGAAPMGPASL